jgi:hypothetical protein
MGCAVSPHLRCVTRTTVALVGASWVTAWAGCKGHGLEVYPVFVWSAIRLEFCKKFWGYGDLARSPLRVTPLRHLLLKRNPLCEIGLKQQRRPTGPKNQTTPLERSFWSKNDQKGTRSPRSHVLFS